MDTNWCSRCGIEKPVTEFWPLLGQKVGYRNQCKQCMAEIAARVYKPKIAVPEGTKRCSVCREVKPLDEFHRAASSKDGLRSNCKACVARFQGREYKIPEVLPEGQKRCTQCKVIYPATAAYFKVDKRAKDGLSTWCKQCASAYTREWYDERIKIDPEYGKRRYQAHRDYHLAHGKLWYQNNKQRHLEYGKKWREENREYVRELDRKYYREHQDKIKARSRDWRKRNQPQYRQYNVEWMRNNPEKVKAMRQVTDSRRRARKQNLPNTFTVREWINCLNYWEDQCAVCRKRERLCADHWLPLAGDDCPGTIAENIVCLCGHCNSTKQAQNPVKWLAEKLGEESAMQKLAEIEAYFESVKQLKSEE